MKAIGIALALLITFSTLMSRADADEPKVGTGESSFQTGASEATSPSTSHTATTTESSDGGHWEETTATCPLGLPGTCGLKVCPDGSLAKKHEYVLPSGDIGDSYTACPSQQTVTTGDIKTAFKQIPMPASALHIQPPHGETLVNFDTIFFTDPFTLDKQVTVLDATVDFHITVAHYTWHYGDGTSTTTQDPGAAYPHQTITHRYLHKGTVNISLDTTYQADYRINGGPQQHLAATVTIPSPTQSLTIRTATPHLVGS